MGERTRSQIKVHCHLPDSKMVGAEHHFSAEVTLGDDSDRKNEQDHPKRGSAFASKREPCGEYRQCGDRSPVPAVEAKRF
jgi:hypothetical protein